MNIKFENGKHGDGRFVRYRTNERSLFDN